MPLPPRAYMGSRSHANIHQVINHKSKHTIDTISPYSVSTINVATFAQPLDRL